MIGRLFRTRREPPPPVLHVAHLARLGADELEARITANPAETARMAEAAAKFGLVHAQLLWGRMLLEGHGTPLDAKAAFRWFSIAAESRDSEAVNMLGRCHERGWGTPVDIAEAARHFRHAALRGHAWAQYNLGQMLLAGDVSPEKRREAFSWHRRAAGAGNAKSMNVVGRFFEDGLDVPRDAQRAGYWFEKAAEGGDCWGQFNFGRLLAGQGRTEQAVIWIRASLESGYPEFRAQIAPLLRESGIPDLVRLGEIDDARQAAPDGAARR